MKKTSKNDDMRPEYDFASMKGGVRGKYASRYKNEPLQFIEYYDEVSEVREMLDRRYDEFKSGQVKPIDGEEAFARLRAKSKKRRSKSR
jgi:hypothetical protein